MNVSISDFFGYLFIGIIGIACIFVGYKIIEPVSQPTDFSVEEEIPINVPAEVIISNITSNSAHISWITRNDSIGYVKFGTQPNTFSTEIPDTNDTSAQRQKRKIHYAKLTNLLPDTRYYFEVYVDEESYSSEAIAKFNFNTFENLDTIPLPNPLLIELPQDFVEGVVYMNAQRGDFFSTVGSTYAKGRTVNIDRSILKNEDGTDFDFTAAEIVVHTTNEDLRRGRIVTDAEEDKVSIVQATAQVSNYSPTTSQSTSPLIIATAEPEPEETPILPQVEEEPEIAPTVQPVAQTPTTPSVLSQNVTVLPSTSIHTGALSQIINLGIGLFLLFLGTKLMLAKLNSSIESRV